VKLPKGFGKNYFTLRAITATSNQVSLNANESRVQSFHMLNFSSDELDAELEEEEELAATLCTLELSLKPCHCNCYYFKRTKKTLRLHPFQKLNLNYFKNLNNSISPPLSIELKKIAALLAEARNDNNRHCEEKSDKASSMTTTVTARNEVTRQSE